MMRMLKAILILAAFGLWVWWKGRRIEWEIEPLRRRFVAAPGLVKTWKWKSTVTGTNEDGQPITYTWTI